MLGSYVSVSVLESYLLLELTRQIAALRSAVQHHSLLPFWLGCTMRWNWELQHLLCDLGWASLRAKSTTLRMAEQRDVRNLGLSWFCWIAELTDPVYWPCYYVRSQLLQCLSHFHLGLLLFGHSLGTSCKLLCIHKKNYRNDWIIAYTYYISNGVSNGFWNNIWRCVVFSILPQVKK